MTRQEASTLSRRALRTMVAGEVSLPRTCGILAYRACGLAFLSIVTSETLMKVYSCSGKLVLIKSVR
jgi:hypothetical protein